jgi:D-sedoheptulose 7-phosphate isomerase
MKYVNELTERYGALKPIECEIEKAVSAVVNSYKNGGKVLLCGNGGSASDCDHVAGELLKGFLMKREPVGEELESLKLALGEDAPKLQRGIPAIPLPQLSGVLSAFANDVDPSLVYAQLVYALGRAGDVLFAFSTSGNSVNVDKAVRCAKALGITVITMTGESGGKIAGYADIAIKAPEKETFKVQEYHLPIYHAICSEAEKSLFGKGDK